MGVSLAKPIPSKVQAWVKKSIKYTTKILCEADNHMPTAFWLSPKVFNFVSVHLQVSDDHLRATTVEWFASSSPWNTNLPHPCHDKAEESSPILVVGWLMQLSRLAPAVTCSHGRSKYNESRILEDLSIEKLPRTRYPNALARVVESHEQQGPMCPMSENLTSS